MLFYEKNNRIQAAKDGPLPIISMEDSRLFMTKKLQIRSKT